MRKSGEGWTALCPAHDDTRNSLSIKPGKGGLVLLYCHAGCSYEQIIAAINIERQEHSMGSSHGKLVGIYPYLAHDGTLLYQVVRYEPKDFRLRRPDGSGGWVANLDGAKRVLYRLPQLLAANTGEPVLIVEGEKDADCLCSLGFVSTTNFGGAAKWRAEYNDCLRNRSVVIIPDNDKPGRDHAEQVAYSLYGVAAKINLIQLPDLPLKGDVSDYFNAGGTPETLREIIDSAVEWQPSNVDGHASADESKDKPLIYTFGEFMSIPFDTSENIAFHLQRGEVGLLNAVTNRGKSTLIRNAILALATGGEFSPVVERGKPRRGLLLDFETTQARLQSDFRIMTRDFPKSEIALVYENLYIACEGMVGDDLLSLSLHMDMIEREALIHKADFIVIDTMSEAFDLRDENNNAEVSRVVIKPLRKLARTLRCAVLIAHHIGKSNEDSAARDTRAYRGRGASTFGCGGATVLLMTADAHDPNRVTLACPKRKDGGEEYERVFLLDRQARWFRLTDDTPPHIPTSYELVLQTVVQPMTRKEIVAALKGQLSARAVDEALQQAVSRIDLSKAKHGLYAPPTLQKL